MYITVIYKEKARIFTLVLGIPTPHAKETKSRSGRTEDFDEKVIKHECLVGNLLLPRKAQQIRDVIALNGAGARGRCSDAAIARGVRVATVRRFVTAISLLGTGEQALAFGEKFKALPLAVLWA